MNVDALRFSHTATVAHETNINDVIPQRIRNQMIFCPKCHVFVGCWDKGDYWLCSRRNHRIIKQNMEKNERKNNS